MNNKPIIGLMLGDPTGIGPEIVAKLLMRKELYKTAKIVIIGDKRILEMGRSIINADFSFPVIQNLEQAPEKWDQPVILDYPTITPKEVTYKMVSAVAGKSVYDTLEFTVKMAAEGKLDAIVFAPLHKEAMMLGG